LFKSAGSNPRRRLTLFHEWLGLQAKHVQFAQRLAKALQLPLEYMDERLTSFQAEQLLQAEKISPSRNKGLIDRKAARFCNNG